MGYKRCRMDSIVITPKRIFIMEYKIGKTAEEALAQIKEQKYYEKFLHQGKEIVLMGVSLGDKERGILGYEVEVLEA